MENDFLRRRPPLLGLQGRPPGQNRCSWVLHSTGATQYLVAIIQNGRMVLVFDQLNSPRFLRRLPLPLEDFRKKYSRGLQPTISSLGFIKEGKYYSTHFFFYTLFFLHEKNVFF